MRDRILTALYRRLARSDRALALALRLRGVLRAVIGHRLSDGIDPERNGEAALVRALAPSLRVVVDVGANLGNWTALVRTVAPEAAVLALEPSPSAVPGFHARHAGDARVTLVEAAAGDAEGTMSFWQEPEGGETASLVGSATGSETPVAVVTLDAELARRGIDRVDLLKIDAEGFDLRVLRGARETLAHGRAEVVQFEYNEPWARAGSTLHDALVLLEEAGYTVRLLRGAGLEAFDYRLWGEFFDYANFVAIRDGSPALATLNA